MSGPYPNVFGSPLHLREDEETFAIRSKRCVSAPFMAARFFDGFDDEDEDESFEDDGLPLGPNRVNNYSPSAKDTQFTPDKACSVCSASLSPLSILIPCKHLICSSCLTGALNIVGEKDMRCATCDKPVENFKLLSPLKLGTALSEDKGDVGSSADLLPSAFEELSLKTNDSTSNKETNQASPTQHLGTLSNGASGDVAVLRIDNVPWVRTS